MLDLRRIQVSVDLSLDLRRGFKAFTVGTAALELPLKVDDQHCNADRAADQGQCGCSLRRGAEQLSGQHVGDLRGTGDHVAGEGRAGSSDGCRDEFPGQVCLLERVEIHRINREDDNEDAHTAIGQDSSGKHDPVDRITVTEEFSENLGNGERSTALLHELAENGTHDEQEQLVADKASQAGGVFASQEFNNVKAAAQCNDDDAEHSGQQRVNALKAKKCKQAERHNDSNQTDG